MASDTPLTDRTLLLHDVTPTGCVQVVPIDFARDLERVVQQMAEALTELHASVDRFCSEQGEWDFYTGDAVKALAAWRTFEEKYK